MAWRREQFSCRLRTRTLELGETTRIMGILNMTPDSFSDGGRFFSVERAVDGALAMLDLGVDVVDLGGESTRPKAWPVTAEDELARVLPVLEGLMARRPDAVVSIDTYHALTARRAVEAGAEIVNDVSGFSWDEAMAETCAELECGVVLMHTRGRPGEWGELPSLAKEEVLHAVIGGLRGCLKAAQAVGIPDERVVLDPGFGFGKMGVENYALLAGLAELQALERPVLCGISRKGFLARTIERFYGDAGELPPMEARGVVTQAANVASVLGGAHLLRVHDVRAAQEAVSVADAILAAG